MQNAEVLTCGEGNIFAMHTKFMECTCLVVLNVIWRLC